MTHWVMDYETLSNCFVGVFQHYKTSEQKIFIVHDLQNDFDKFIEFLIDNRDEKQWHISYNGLAFDAQVTQYILNNHELWSNMSGCAIAEVIYKFAQETIARQNRKEWGVFAPWHIQIGQIDLFKMHHWDNPAKSSSLKWIQFSMDWENLQDMPIEHTVKIETQEQLDTIVGYCINDVASTKAIFDRSKSQIKLRKELTDKYQINLYSASEPRIAKELFAYHLGKKLSITPREIKGMKTYRNIIKVKDLVLPYIKFKSPVFQQALNKFNTLELDAMQLKGQFKYKLEHNGVHTTFALGGIHGARKSGVYKSDDQHIIMSSDVTSFYPNLCIRNQWSPAHFPKEEFCDQYEWFFDERVKIPKSNPMNYVYKIILNSTFGLSNEENSFFYDPELCMRITLNGQLSLMMLYDMILDAIPEAFGLLQNTDGVEIRIPRDKKDLYLKVCEEWENITQLNLEHDTYQKLILGDVNNYIAVNDFKSVDLTAWRKVKEENPHYLFKVKGPDFMYAPVKLKGRFNFHELALHKNKSKLVVPKAIYNYFVKDVLPEDYLQKNRNILDYCIGMKSKGAWKQVARSTPDGVYKERDLQKINRYYISKPGNNSEKMFKINKDDGREIQCEAGKWMQSLFNEIQLQPKWGDYRIDMAFYSKAIESEINNIISSNINQLTLF
jgi:hypothetical protein